MQLAAPDARPTAPAGGRPGTAGLAWGPLLLAAVLAAVVWFVPVAGLPRSARAGLVCLIFAIAIWSLDALPKGVSSLVVIVALLLTGAAKTFAEAAAGFANNSIYFILAMSLVGNAALAAGLAGRAAGLLLFLGRGRRAATLWALSATLSVLGFFMPTAAGRFQAIRPVLEEVGDNLGEPVGSGFHRGGLILAGVFGPYGSVGLMTGGGLSIVAAGLLAQQGIGLDWLQWMIAMLPVAWLLFAVATWIVTRSYLRTPDRRAVIQPAPSRPLSRQEWWVAGTLGGATLLWVGGGLLHLDPAVPAILAALALSLPQVGLIGGTDVARMDWNGLLMIGAALSLGDNLARGGLGDWLTRQVAGDGAWLTHPATLLALLLLGLALRALIISLPACLSLLLPLLVHLAPSHAAAVPLALAFTFALGTFQPLPTHSPSSIIGFASGGYSLRDQVTMSLLVLPASLALTLVAYYFYWPRLHL